MPDISNRLQLLLVKFLGSQVVAAPDSATSKNALALQLVPGQRVQASVEANLPNGNLKILVANQALQVSLPKSAQPGDVLDLIFVSHEPRPTFVLSESANVSKPQPTFSSTGRLVSSLLPQTDNNTASRTILGPAPILTRPPGSVPEFAARLQQTLSQSGLFYESHQAQWVIGSRPLTELLPEPQAKLLLTFRASAEELPPANPSYTKNAAPQTAPQLAKPTEELPPADPSYTKIAAPQTGAQLTKPAEGPSRNPDAEVLFPDTLLPSKGEHTLQVKSDDNPIHPNSLTLVQNQLHALETQQLAWRGEVWPGQWLEWEVAERQAEPNAGEERRTWETKLNLVLPSLGDVSATLQLNSKGVHVSLRARDDRTAALLQANDTALRESLEASDLTILSMTVNPHAETRP